MKRVSRVFLLAIFGLLLLGGTNAYAGDHGNSNSKGDKDKGNNGQGNNNSQGNGGGGLVNLIENIISDIFGDINNQGNNQGNSQGTGGNSNPTSWTNGGGTAPIDGGLSLLLIAGLGLGVSKIAGRRQQV